MILRKTLNRSSFFTWQGQDSQKRESNCFAEGSWWLCREQLKVLSHLNAAYGYFVMAKASLGHYALKFNATRRCDARRAKNKRHIKSESFAWVINREAKKYTLRATARCRARHFQRAAAWSFFFCLLSWSLHFQQLIMIDDDDVWLAWWNSFIIFVLSKFSKFEKKKNPTANHTKQSRDDAIESTKTIQPSSLL